jgi:hypothetical protein
MKKAIYSLLLSALILSGSAFIIACQDISGVGEGTAPALSGLQRSVAGSNAFHIVTDQADLADVDTDLSGTFVLENDIDLDDWIPVGDPNIIGVPFTGILDGDGHTITINSFDSGVLSGNEYLGIFAASSGATFINVTVNVASNPIVTDTAQYVGGLVAYAERTTFDTITVTGSLELDSTVDADLDVGLVAGYAAAGSTFINDDVAANLNVLYNNDDTTAVNAGGLVGYVIGSKLIDVDVDGEFTVTADMPYYYVPDNSVRLGGVAGYAEQAAFVEVTIDTGTFIEAVSEETPVYAGGVVGRGLNITIDDSASSAIVTGNGPGYNTSAGGIAGYIVQSTVQDSQADGAITLAATWTSSSDGYWQIYAGGLVGYSGGNESGNSVIDHSHASGAVSVTAPYPYAGGLLGYNYGYNDFSSPAERWAYYHGKGIVTATFNGSRVTRSYATGNAVATSTPGSKGIPYAGGLAGYSSINATNAPNIENCYATGNATGTTDSKYGWVGGLLGANAQGSVVSKTYATGNVFVSVGSNEIPYPQPSLNPGAVGASIVGMNYYLTASGAAPVVELSVGLSTLIDASAPSVIPILIHRVVGDLGLSGNQGIVQRNYAYDRMLGLPSSAWNPQPNINGLDGDDTLLQPAQQVYSINLGWDFTNVWYMGTNGYPALY